MKTRKERMEKKDDDRRMAKNQRTITRLKEIVDDLTARIVQLEKGK